MYNIFLNPSIAAILFGIAVIVLFTQVKNTGNTILFVCTAMLFLLCIGCTIYYNSRVVWLGIAIVLTLITIIEKNIQFKTIQKIGIVGGIVVLVIIAFSYKENSTLGRIFIYKINALVIQKHWLRGINEPYSVIFNHTQANYFLNNANATLQQKLLAGNNYFVLNEWLNILIHYGMVVFIFTLLATIYLIKICFKQLKLFPNKAWAVGIVLFLLMVSLASYPFSFIPYLFIFGISALYVLRDAFKLPQKINNTIFCTLFIGFSAICLNDTYAIINAEKEKKAITDLFRVGYINQALSKALVVQNTQPPNEQVYEQIAAIYLQKNKLDSAIFYIEKTHNFICNDELHNFWGKCFVLQQKPHQASNQFEIAVNIVPHRFKNRIDLLNTYLLLNNFEKAKKCAAEIVELPEKIPSKQSAQYKQKAQQILNTLAK